MSEYCVEALCKGSQESLINIAVAVMQVDALGLQSFVDPVMRRQKGNSWINDEFRHLKGHLWKNACSSEVQFDFEGIMSVIVRFYNCCSLIIKCFDFTECITYGVCSAHAKLNV